MVYLTGRFIRRNCIMKRNSSEIYALWYDLTSI
jgi:hypothetical protein